LKNLPDPWRTKRGTISKARKEHRIVAIQLNITIGRKIE